MKKLTLSVLVSASILALSGCGSTSNNAATEPTSNLKALEIASTDKYTWDNEKSFAFNLARLSNPAGVGFGMTDSVNPKGTDLGRSESSLLSGVSGFMLGGLGGAAGLLAMDSDSNAKRDWNPSVISFYDESDLDLSDPVAAKKIVENSVSNRLVKAVQVQYPDTVLHGKFTRKNNPKNDAVMVLSGNVCEAAFQFGRLPDIDYKIKDSFERIKPTLNEDTSNINDGCITIFTSKVVGKVNGKIAVVSEMDGYSLNTFIINTARANIKHAYIMYPDRSEYFIAGERRKHYFPYPYPAVVSDGKEFLLDSNNISSAQEIEY